MSECLPGYEPLSSDQSEDLELRKAATVLNPPTSQVILSEEGHPSLGLVCEVCGSGMKLLSSCGIVLCVPCWHKAAIRSFEEISPVIDRAARGRHRHHGIRFVDLTIRHRKGESLVSVHTRLMRGWNLLRRSQFWKSHVDGCILKREVTYGENGWHPHLHMLTVGRFIPATRSKTRKGEESLSDVWKKVTGDSTVVHIEAPRRTGYRGRELVQELAKYVSKPVAYDDDGTPIRIDGWPREVRLELARFLAGGTRIKWYCRPHHSRHRRGCLNYLPPSGFRAPPRCLGEYRKERTGFRRLIWYGDFKKIRDELKAHEPLQDQKTVCRKCEIGRMRSEYWWDESEDQCHIHPNAGLALQFIQAHKSTDYDSLLEYFKGQNKEGPPRGWVPNYANEVRTPLREVRNQDVGYYILEVLRSGIENWYVIVDGLQSLGQDFERIGWATRCQLIEGGYVEPHSGNGVRDRVRLSGKGKWRMHCWPGEADGLVVAELNETNLLDESSHPGRNFEDASLKTEELPE